MARVGLYIHGVNLDSATRGREVMGHDRRTRNKADLDALQRGTAALAFEAAQEYPCS